jgi:hypothetical protein
MRSTMKTPRICSAALVLLLLFRFLELEAKATLNIQIGHNFTGATFNVDAFDFPPDSDGAIGPNHYVELINGRFSVYDKTTGARVQTMTDAQFWTNAGINLTRVDVTDPRIIFDKLTQRWFVSQIDFNPSGIFSSNRFLLAVSTTANPTNAWNAVGFLSDLNGNTVDFDTLGLDANGVYIAGDMFDISGNFAGVQMVSLPKADLLLSPPTISNRASSGIMAGGDSGFTLQPVINFNPTNGGEVVLSVPSDGSAYDTNFVPIPQSTLDMFQVLNASSAAATFTTPTNIAVPSYSININPPQPGDSSDITTYTLDDGDARIGASVYQVGNVIYAAHGTQLNPAATNFPTGRAAIRWYKINATDFSLIQSGTITDPDLSLFYPSITANEKGCVVIGFNGGGTNTYVSSYAVVGETINGVTTFGDIILLKAGVARYELFGSGSDARNRWGDYSAISVDPVNPDHFWTIQEFPSAANVWSTQITELVVIPLPTLQITTDANDLMLSWPTNANGFVLQSADNLAPVPNWSRVTAPVSVVGDQNTVTIAATNAMQFFRLQQ